MLSGDRLSRGGRSIALVQAASADCRSRAAAKAAAFYGACGWPEGHPFHRRHLIRASLEDGFCLDRRRPRERGCGHPRYSRTGVRRYGSPSFSAACKEVLTKITSAQLQIDPLPTNIDAKQLKKPRREPRLSISCDDHGQERDAVARSVSAASSSRPFSLRPSSRLSSPASWQLSSWPELSWQPSLPLSWERLSWQPSS